MQRDGFDAMVLMRKLLAGFVLAVGLQGAGSTVLHAQAAVAPPLRLAASALPFGHEPLRCLPGRHCIDHHVTICVRSFGNHAPHNGSNPDCACRPTRDRC